MTKEQIVGKNPPSCFVACGPGVGQSTAFDLESCKIELVDYDNQVQFSLRGKDGAALFRVDKQLWKKLIAPKLNEVLDD